MNRSPNRCFPTRRFHLRALLAGLLLAGALLFGLACLEPETVPQFTRACICTGIRCVNSQIGKLSYSSDEESGACSCHVQQLGMCVDGCGPHPNEDTDFTRKDCPVSFVCQAWTRVEPGTACKTDRDCEPGMVDGEPSATLACVKGACADVGASKWSAEVVPARACAGEPEFGVHPSCEGTACVATEMWGNQRYCSVAKCIVDSDCPTHWRCSCRDEYTWEGLRSHRWCVPDLATFPAEALIPLPSED